MVARRQKGQKMRTVAIALLALGLLNCGEDQHPADAPSDAGTDACARFGQSGPYAIEVSCADAVPFVPDISVARKDEGGIPSECRGWTMPNTFDEDPEHFLVDWYVICGGVHHSGKIFMFANGDYGYGEADDVSVKVKSRPAP